MHKGQLLACAVLFLALHLVPTASLAQNNTTCGANPYALCSHALCTCLDAAGQPTNCPSGTDASNDTVWSSCQCPVVKVSGALEYNANIGNTACPQRIATTMPPFLSSPAAQRASQLIYSQYSLGDAIADSSFGTLSGAVMQQCAAKDEAGGSAQFANCLDQPCFWDGVSGTAMCYCPVNAATSTWNTFAASCDASICDTAADKVWSAAPVGLTKQATGYVQAFIAAHSGTPANVNYCPLN